MNEDQATRIATNAIDYQAAPVAERDTRINQLERQCAVLAAEIDAQRQREQALSDAYLRLRRLIGREAFDTPHGPSGEQVWATTEAALGRLVAEIDRQRAEYNAEVDEFNAGYDAAQQGLPESSEPSDVKYDVWKCGYAWAMFDKLKAEIDLMRPVVEATVKQIRRDDDLFSWSDLKDAVDDYEAAKGRG